MPAARRKAADSREARRAALLAAYAPLPGVHDELMAPDGSLRPQWRELIDLWSGLSDDEMRRRFALAERHLSDAGVSYRARGEIDAGDMLAGERPWPISHVPLPIGAEEWRHIEAGVIQRATLVEAMLQDIYGPQSLIASGALPATAVAGSPDFLRPLRGAPVPGGQHLLLYACDLGRGPDGRWWVLGDRTQAPSGVGYALENRLAMARAFPDIYRQLQVERLAGFFQGFREGLVSRARRSEPRICLLTPGPLSETYFEQAYLARYLGFMLVEGGDLVMRDDRVHVRTIAGLKRADVIWRRIDGDFADPLELNAASRLGVAGLIQSIRKGELVMANSLGSGVIEARALLSFMPMLARRLLGQELILPNVATWWCGQPQERAAVLEVLDILAISSAFRGRLPGAGGDGPMLTADLKPQDRAELARLIETRGLDVVGQEVVQLSTMPVLDNGQLKPRPFSLRVYAAATPQGWRVMPGGFCRISDRLDARAVSMREGARASDVWVLSDGPVAQTTLLPPPDQIAIRRIVGNLPSRAADNLFWLGRYLERAEAVLRLSRTLLGRLIDGDERFDRQGEATRRLLALMISWAAAPNTPRASAFRQVVNAMHASEQYGSAFACLREAKRTASVIRERLSIDAWRLIGDMVRALEPRSAMQPTEGEAYETADTALRQLAAFSGLAEENMNRGDGWRFLEIGRRLERALATCRFTRQFGDANAPAECLEVLLDLIDSPITYRSRYLVGVAHQPVLDMALFDEFNPRSVGFQVARLDAEVAALPRLRDDGMVEPPRRLAIRLAADMATARAEQADKQLVLSIEQRLMELSDAIGARYFLQTGLDSPVSP